MSTEKNGWGAECTWGDGPDVLLVNEGGGYLLHEGPDKSRWAHGLSACGSADLTIEEACRLIDELTAATENARRLEVQYAEDNVMQGSVWESDHWGFPSAHVCVGLHGSAEFVDASRSGVKVVGRTREAVVFDRDMPGGDVFWWNGEGCQRRFAEGQPRTRLLPFFEVKATMRAEPDEGESAIALRRRLYERSREALDGRLREVVGDGLNAVCVFYRVVNHSSSFQCDPEVGVSVSHEVAIAGTK